MVFEGSGKDVGFGSYWRAIMNTMNRNALGATALGAFLFAKNRVRQGKAAKEKERFIMALTRKMLKAMGIEEDKIEQIIEAHSETVDALKDRAERSEEDAKKLPAVQKELDDLKRDGGDWQKKYEKEHSDFEAFKSAQTEKETNASKEKAYRALLVENGVSEKRIDAIMRITDLTGVELDKEGKIKDADKHSASIKADYADFIVTTGERGVWAAKPPKGGNEEPPDLGSLSMKDYIAARKNK